MTDAGDNPSQARLIGAVVPTFCPDDALEDRLRALRPQVDRLCLVDDGSSAEVRDRLNDIASKLDAMLLLQTDNRGIAAAFNRGVATLHEAGCDRVLLLDQDSRVEDNLVARLTELWNAQGDQQIGVLAANYQDSAGRPGYAVPRQVDVSPIPYAISSGSLVAVGQWQAVGGCDQALFIDGVDIDLCLRLRAAGCQVLATRQTLLAHHVGHQRVYRVLGKTFSMSGHSPLRRYYMARNQVILFARHLGRFPGLMIKLACVSAAQWLLMALLETRRWAKLRAVCLGLVHGLTGRRGRLQPRRWMVDATAGGRQS